MRIISGFLKGRRFTPPTQLKARPTTDFAKEGLFNLLSNRMELENIQVLELFAGSGSMGLEFVSRGASTVTGVEISAQHIGYIKKICKELGVDNYFLQRADVFKFLEHAQGAYQVIFADPPYQLKELPTIPNLIFEKQLLDEQGWLILEHGREHHFQDHPHFVEERKYGNVHFSFFSAQVATEGK
ncbi:MAG: 16S rRNA (guanine(966)-N(2))-methyltransferase RsmD [Paludibacteraceae bacterium]|jgi:16S rRNA (guanine(966)-N(2))-methyltransferase RsmD|nr:16S rRNA (guanine(966)-N(2))-methyltransferase RsmD [Paludibacteraceae bacterium]MEE1173929.1 16S rRNA (guanine(966)-N(2))-methyltransferase RsmD [Paludibacteraceae bacterium]